MSLKKQKAQKIISIVLYKTILIGVFLATFNRMSRVMKPFVFIILLFCSMFASASSINKIVVFGDSLSDNGNLYEYMKQQLPLSPPYYQGRFTNGPVWVELLTKMCFPNDVISDHLLDYAFGGAGVSEEADDDENEMFSLKREVDGYLMAHQDKADSNSLFVVWIGANNYLALPDDEDAAVSNVIKGIEHGLKHLAAQGAQHILVVNLPDLGRIPTAQDFDMTEVLTRLSDAHNQKLMDLVQEMKNVYPNVDWIFFDVRHTMSQIYETPEQFGFRDVSGTCYEAMMDAPSSDACQGFLFFDPVHPASHLHEIMASQVKTLFSSLDFTFE